MRVCGVCACVRIFVSGESAEFQEPASLLGCDSLICIVDIHMTERMKEVKFR